MDSKFKKSKAISFKTATLIVIGLHGLGFLALSQWGSFRASIAKSKWNERKERLVAQSEQERLNSWPQQQAQKIKTEVQAVPTPTPRREESPTQIVQNKPTPTPLTETAKQFIASKTKEATKAVQQTIKSIPPKVVAKPVVKATPKPKPTPQVVYSKQITRNYDHNSSEEIVIQRRVVRSYTVPIISSSSSHSRQITITPVY
jgi:hypothetical protein